MTVSLYIAFRSIPDEDVQKFIQDLKDFLAAQWAGRNISLQINTY